MLGTVRLMVELVLEKQIIIDRYSHYHLSHTSRLLALRPLRPNSLTRRGRRGDCGECHVAGHVKTLLLKLRLGPKA